MNVKFLLVSLLIASPTVFAGSVQVIDNANSPATGDVEVRANVVSRVSLTISDTGANELVSPTGIDFGTVDADGTTGSIAGTPLGDRAQYVGSFIFSANRSGNGNVTLTAERSVAGTFNGTDGLLIEDSSGSLQNLATGGSAVTVVDDTAEGDFTKSLGITVHTGDTGALASTVRFTLSAL